MRRSLGPGVEGDRGAAQRVFETSFIVGRQFTSPGDFNAQFIEWLGRANSRVVRAIRERPAELIEADRAAMLPLPPAPPQVGWHHRVRLDRDLVNYDRAFGLVTDGGQVA